MKYGVPRHRDPKTGEIYALCGLHVDDGMLSGNPKDPRFIKLQKEIDSRFNIKEWLDSAKDTVTLLGVEVKLEKGRVEKYIDKMKAMVVKNGEESLAGKELTESAVWYCS